MLRVGDFRHQVLRSLLHRYDLELEIVVDDKPVTASFWGDSEAGIAGRTVYARDDTPLHSLLHEAGHVICMTTDRRASLYRDAGGDDLEEAAVCYLQILLADCLDGAGRERMMSDMDEWGYSFRLGSTRAWFLQDAEDARNFLLSHRLITDEDVPTLHLRS